MIEVKQDPDHPLVESVLQVVNHEDCIALIVNMGPKNVEHVLNGGFIVNGGYVEKSFVFRHEGHEATITVHATFSGMWRTICEPDRYGAYLCLFRVPDEITGDMEVWTRESFS